MKLPASLQGYKQPFLGLLVVAAGLGVYVLAPELNQWAGRYEVVRVLPGQGNWTESDLKRGIFRAPTWEGWYLELGLDRRIKTGWTWSCGADGSDTVSGDARRIGNTIQVMERSWAYQSVSPNPSLTLEVRGHEIIREVPIEGGTVKLVFARTRAANPILAVFGLE